MRESLNLQMFSGMYPWTFDLVFYKYMYNSLVFYKKTQVMCYYEMEWIGL